MKCFARAATFAALAAHVQAASEASPVNKVLQLLDDLHAKVSRDGEESKQLYTEFAAWCEDRAANLKFEIKTGESTVQDLQATIGQETATIASLSTKVEELASAITTNEADLKAATAIRSKESADFEAEQKDLTQVIDMLSRAITVIEKELRKGGATMVQLKSATSLAQAMSVMVQSSIINTADASRLAAFVQAAQQSQDSESELGAPEAAAYESHSGGVLKTLADLRDQAQTQLAAARKRETADLHSFELLRQSLEDSIKFGNKEIAEAKQSIAASSERKSAAEGDLEATSKELAADKAAFETVSHDCQTKAQDYEAEVKSRNEELKALSQAKAVIAENTGGAASLSYGLNQVSLLQLSSGADLAHFEAVRFVRDLATKFKAPALTQLAANMAAVSSFGTRAGQDPFAKIKGLIAEMIKKLEDEAGAEAAHKAYCDKELAETRASKAAKDGKIEKLSTKIDQMSARSAQLKEEVAALQNGLAALAKSQAEMDQVRRQEHEVFLSEKATLEQGLQGIKTALKVLRDYYGQADKAHNSGEESATGIIGLIEVVESDFSKGLAETIAAEDAAQRQYVETSRQNEIEKAAKEQDVKYKTKESTDLDKSVAEASSDRSTVQAELDAVHDYLAKLEEECIAKAEPYAARAAAREAEIEGLKQALESLSGEAVLLQQSARRTLRGVRAHVSA